MPKRNHVPGVSADRLPCRIAIDLSNKPEIARKLQAIALRRKATFYTEVLELLINESEASEQLHKQLRELLHKQG